MYFIFSFLCFLSSFSWAAVQNKNHLPLFNGSTANQMESIRAEVAVIEGELLEGLQMQNKSQYHLKKIRKLIKVQNLERKLAEKRLNELQQAIQELDLRQAALLDRSSTQQKTVRKILKAIEISERTGSIQLSQTNPLGEAEKLEAPRKKTLRNLVDRGLKDLEALRIDLTDAALLSSRIQDEKQQLTYLTQEFKEQETFLELNRQLQIDFLKKKKTRHLSQWEDFQKLKNAESQVQYLLGEFNARKELEHTAVIEKGVSQAMVSGIFAKQKGHLPFPVSGGKVIAPYGRGFDAQLGLFIFKKGIDILIGKNEPVRAVSPGKIAFAGDLPNYGQVVIIDHGDHFYSLCAHLGKILRKSNDFVSAGDSIALTGNSSNPLYFEIRSRNVAVNPLQWLFN